MRVFMLGWEFPPFISGGLGTACYGLTKAMSGTGTDVLFVLPRAVSSPFSSHVKLIRPQAGSVSSAMTAEFRLAEFENVTFRTIDASLTSPYQTPQDFQQQAAAGRQAGVMHADGASAVDPAGLVAGAAIPAALAGGDYAGVNYAGDLFFEVQRYAALAAEIARTEMYDIVHAHDWMTFAAGLSVAALRGVPLVVHVHSTEFDRSGSNVNQKIYDIERRGMHGAIKIIAVSHLTKMAIVNHYGIDPGKIEVVYNAIETQAPRSEEAAEFHIAGDEKVVLFLGRITLQKGPEYFLAAAKKVLEVMGNVKFVMAGSGDLTARTIEMANELGIGGRVLFTGFLKQDDVTRLFRLADLYVMPSVSEPFGIAPLEAMSHDVPVIISKQSGVSEVLNHVLKVDFWDVDEMANKIVAVLKHPPLASMLREHGAFEVRKLCWDDAARRCLEVYDAAIDTMKLGTMPTPG